MKPRLIPSEHFEQVALVTWWRVQFPRVRILAIPNGGDRSLLVAKKLKAEGVQPGVPDLFVPAWNLWIEMKRQKLGVVSPEQNDWRDYLLAVGHSYIIGKGFEDVRTQVLEFNGEQS